MRFKYFTILMVVALLSVGSSANAQSWNSWRDNGLGGINPSWAIGIGTSTDRIGYGWFTKIYGDGSNLTGLPSGGAWTNAGTYIYANNSSSTVVTDAGALGSGTTTPTYKFESVGTSTSGFFGVSQNSAGDIFTIDNSGNVGIGTTTPSAALEVSPVDTIELLSLVANTGDYDTDLFAIKDTSGNKLFTIDTSTGGDYRTSVLGNSRSGKATQFMAGTDDAWFNLIGGKTTATNSWVSISGVDRAGYNNQIVFRALAPGDIIFETGAGTDRLVIDNAGNVGIGTDASPDYFFDVQGITHIDTSLGINTPGADRKLDVLDATNPQLRLTHTDGTVYTDFQTTASGHLSISGSGGNVGIATTTPTTTLTVWGKISLTNGDYASCTALETDANGEIRCGSDDVGGGSGLFTTSSNQLIHPVDTNDSLVIGGTATTSASIMFEVIGDTKLSGDLTVTGTSSLSFITGDYRGTAITDGYISSAATWTGKEDILSFSLPLSRTGDVILITTSTAASHGFLTLDDWTTFNSKADLIDISSTATGLTYTSGSGVISLTAGYNIPLTASTTDWTSAFDWGDHSLLAYALNSFTTSTDMQSDDFGDWSCDGTDAGCTLDTDSVDDNEINYTNVTLADLTDDVGYVASLHNATSSIIEATTSIHSFGTLISEALATLASLTVTGTTTLDTDFTGFLKATSGVVSTSTVDISDDTNLTAGDHLTLTDDDIDLDAEVITKNISFVLDTPTTTRAFFVGQMRWRAPVALTITEVNGGMSAGTTTIQLYETTAEARSATGTAILSSALGVNPNASTTGFADASIAAGNFIMLYVDTQAGGDSGGDVSVKYTIDD